MNYHLQTILRSFARPVARLTATAVIFLSPGAFGVMPGNAADESEEGVEVLTRGPVHEAFAATITFKPVSGFLVPKAPPSPIEELPPDQRPEGDNVTWIPGYWAWEDESTEFLWVSGIWRNLPPGRQWMPGYWSDSGQDFQWISGYWADATVEEVEYLDPPPASIEAGPNIERPSRNHSWIPGNWVWREARYRWRPGYWDLPQRNWVWVPSNYVSTPRGYIYVDGYYDYDVPRRGMVFAPVRFSGGHYSRPNYYYRPSTVISTVALVDHLFLRPRTRHYYFGDYYAPEYRRSGYYASYNYYSGGHGYDPIYAQQRWSHRDDNRWERRREENFQYFRDNRDERPPHTLAALTTFMAAPDRNRRVEAGFATRLDQFVSSKEAPVKLTAVNEAEQKVFTQRGKEIRDFGNQRKKFADPTAATADPANPGTVEPGRTEPGKTEPGKAEPGKTEPVRVKMPRSPIVAKVPEGGAPENTPPKRPEVTTADDKTGEKEDPRRRPGTKGGRETPPDEKPKLDPKGQPIPEPTDPQNPRRRDPKMDPKADPKDPSAPKVDPKDPSVPKGEPKDPSVPKVDPKDPSVPKGEPKDPSKDVPKSDPENPRRRGPKLEPKDVPKPEPKIEPKDVPKPEPKIEPGELPKREPKIEPKDIPKREPKIEPREIPKREPKIEPAEIPKREPKLVPKEEPKREPRVEPRPEIPKVDPRRDPRPEPRPQPKVEPREQPKPPSRAPATPATSAPNEEKEKEKRRKAKALQD